MADRGNAGSFIEEEVRRVVAELGVADFVYAPPRPPKGGGNREVGDALLIANGRGGMMQVKTRDLAVGAADTPERTAAWIDKHCRRAYDQAVGSIRNIDHHIMLGNPLLAVPYRARNLSDSEQQQAVISLATPATGWPTIVVVDHPQATGVHPPDLPAFFVTFDDLVELMASIRSVTGFLGYVDRVLQHGGPQLPLGYEHQAVC